MATPDDLRQIAMSFAEVTEGQGAQIGYGVTVKGKHKGIAWEWLERPESKAKRVPNPGVYAIRTQSLLHKEALLQEAGQSGKIFTEPHYNNYPAVLVRLELVSVEELRDLFESGYESFVK